MWRSAYGARESANAQTTGLTSRRHRVAAACLLAAANALAAVGVNKTFNPTNVSAGQTSMLGCCSSRVPRGAYGRTTSGGRPFSYDKHAYRGRNVIERAFNGFTHLRGLATR